MKTVNEGSAIQVIAVPRDITGIPLVPASLRYRIDCLTTGKELVGFTSIASPIAGENTINVDSSVNAIQDDDNRTERKQMIVETTGALGTRNDKIVWDVQNFYGIR